MENAIEVGSFYYQNLWEGLNLSIEKNKLVAISGPNNCGKTTLMRILNREIIVESDIKIENRPINEYRVADYAKLVECVIPLEKIPLEKTIEEEMFFKNDNTKEVEWVIKGLKIKKIKSKLISELNTQEFIYYQLATAIISFHKIILLDSLGSYLTEKEVIDILQFLKEVQEKKEMTVIHTTIHLKETLYCDYLYILDEKKVALKGLPLEILEKDNIINKIGLNLPFMVDLSVKLRDYDLIENIELDQDRMIEELWK